MKFDICVFFENLPRNFTFHSDLTRKAGSLHEDQYTFMVISRLVFLRMRNISDKICRENENTYFTFDNSFFLKSSVYEIMCKNIVQPVCPQMTI